MKIKKDDIKNICFELGAELAGIASVDRFNASPKGFHPADVLPSCKSVIVLACEVPKESIDFDPVLYTMMRDEMINKIDQLAVDVSEKVKNFGFDSYPLKSMDGKIDNGRYRGLISFTHAGVYAGLGQIGKNKLLINNLYGNMLWLGAVLNSVPLQSDSIASYEVCSERCNICVKCCPSSALGDELINQLSCYSYSYKTAGNKLEIQCWECRKKCPQRFGL